MPSLFSTPKIAALAAPPPPTPADTTSQNAAAAAAAKRKMGLGFQSTILSNLVTAGQGGGGTLGS